MTAIGGGKEGGRWIGGGKTRGGDEGLRAVEVIGELKGWKSVVRMMICGEKRGRAAGNKKGEAVSVLELEAATAAAKERKGRQPSDRCID